MPNATLARYILDSILTHPDQYDQSAWFTSDHLLTPDAEPECGTTLCVAGWAAHLSGYTLVHDGWPTAIKDGEHVSVDRAAELALNISPYDAAVLFHGDLLPEQAIAALDQLADGAPQIDWECANAAAYGLADGDFSAAAEQKARGVWGITHDLIVDGVRRTGSRGIAPTAMRFIVAGWEDDREPGSARAFWRDELGVWTTAGGRRYVPRLTDAAVVYPGSMQGTDDTRRIVGSYNMTSVAPFGSRRLHYAIVPAAKLPELAASPDIRTVDTPAPERVYSYLNTSWPPLENDVCQRCRAVGFLSRATEWPGRPAFCVDCHDTLRTAEAIAGHQCVDNCPQAVGHDGLCTLL
ncbi:hypothetical protein ABZ502_32725 [Streptomyces abikoensis]|uniref:hypothetical protein n=1 Tax=Streptomyces abikoensis TaxID=97398 RepID=UPI0033E887DB